MDGFPSADHNLDPGDNTVVASPELAAGGNPRRGPLKRWSIHYWGDFSAISQVVSCPKQQATNTQTSNGSPVVLVEHFNKHDTEPVMSQNLNAIRLVMIGRIAPGLGPRTFYSVMTTSIKLEEAGRYTLGAQVTGAFA